jgi:hypothetical protein
MEDGGARAVRVRGAKGASGLLGACLGSTRGRRGAVRARPHESPCLKPDEDGGPEIERSTTAWDPPGTKIDGGVAEITPPVG